MRVEDAEKSECLVVMTGIEVEFIILVQE